MKSIIRLLSGLGLTLAVCSTSFSQTWELEVEVTCTPVQATFLQLVLEGSRGSWGIKELNPVETPEGIRFRVVASDPNAIVDVERLLREQMEAEDPNDRIQGYRLGEHPIFLGAFEEGDRALSTLARDEAHQTVVRLKHLSGITPEDLLATYGIHTTSLFGGELIMVAGTREQLVRVVAERGFNPYNPRFGGKHPDSITCQKNVANSQGVAGE